jgi:hypothetical protein
MRYFGPTLGDLGRPASVDGQDHAGDEGRPIRGEEGRHLGQFLRRIGAQGSLGAHLPQRGPEFDVSWIPHYLYRADHYFSL